MFKDFINLIFPIQYAGCSSPLVQSEKAICSGCWMELKDFDKMIKANFYIIVVFKIIILFISS